MRARHKYAASISSTIGSSIYFMVKRLITDKPADFDLGKLLNGTASKVNYLDAMMYGIQLTGLLYFYYTIHRSIREIDKQHDIKRKVMKIYEQLDGLVTSHSRNPWYRKRLISNVLDNVDSEGKTLVSLGGGSGKIENELSKSGFEIVSVDTSLIDLKRCKKRNSDIECILADAENLPLKKESTDVIFSNEAIGYMNSDKIFSESNFVLKEKGLVQISTYAKNRFNQIEKYYELYYPGEFEEIATRHGLKDVETEEFMSFSPIIVIPRKMMVTTARK